MKSSLIMATVISLLFLSSFAALGVSSGYTYVPPFSQSISLPSYAFEGQNFTMYVNDTYGFTNYTVTTYIGGDNLTGLSPQSAIHKFNATNPDFSVTVTAPSAVQTLYFQIISAANFDGANVTSSAMYAVSVVTPIVFHAEVRNTGISAVRNLTVNFYLDNSPNPIGDVTIPSLAPNQQVVVNFTYPAQTISPGEHTLTVSTQSSLIQINGNSASSSSHFYYGTPPNYNWIYYVAVVVVIFMVFIAYSAGRRPQAGTRPPKWRRNK